jgi:transposase
MTSGQVEVITSVQRRRRWSRTEKERIVAAAIEPGAVASEIARAAGIHTSQLFRWRQELCGPAKAAPQFAALTVAAESQAAVGSPLPATTGLIEIEFSAGARMRISGPVDPLTVSTMIKGVEQGRPGSMIALAAGTRVWLATGRTDMRKGFDGLALLVQERLKHDPHCGHLFVFRGRRGDLIKILWHDGQGLCLYAKRLERGRFIWPSMADGVVTITAAQLGYLLEGIDWRAPQQTWRPQAAG